MSEPLPLAAAAVRLRRRPGRPKLPDEERAKRKQARDAACIAALAQVVPRLLGVPAAAKYLGLSVWTVRDLLASGQIRRVVIPGDNGNDLRRILVDRTDLDVLVSKWKA